MFISLLIIILDTASQLDMTLKSLTDFENAKFRPSRAASLYIIYKGWVGNSIFRSLADY